MSHFHSLGRGYYNGNNGFIGNLNYASVLFSLFDGEKPGFFAPLNCRGIFCGTLFSPQIRKEIKFAPDHCFEDFKPDYSKLNWILCIKDSRVDEIKPRIKWINDNKNLWNTKKVKINEDLVLTQLFGGEWDLKEDDENVDWTAYNLTGPKIYQSSYFMVSFITNIIKYGEKSQCFGYNTSKYPYSYATPADFISIFKKSDYFTDDVDKIIEHFNTNFEKDPAGHGYRGKIHDYGANYWLADQFKKEALEVTKKTSKEKVNKTLDKSGVLV